MRQLLFIILNLLMIVGLLSCTKSNSNPSDLYDMSSAVYEFGFEYKGNSYTCKQGEWSLLKGSDNNIAGISIYKLDLFDGDIFYNSECPFAFMQPLTGKIIDYESGCNLKCLDGSDIDSLNTYLYKLGKLNVSISNVRQVKVPCFCSSHYLYITVKDIIGDFELTLANKRGDEIKITKGSFKALGAVGL